MTKKLIALAVIAAGTLAADSIEIAIGTKFEAADELADKLIQDGSAKEDVPAASKVKTVKGRVLIDCAYGRANDVIDLPATSVKDAEASGQVDTNKEAVAYALTLEQNKA